MWTVIYVTDDIAVAKNLKVKLETMFIKARIKKRFAEDSTVDTFEVLVPDAEISFALSQIN